MPYRIDLQSTHTADVLDRLVELGALDVEALEDDTIAAIMPDAVGAPRLARALGLRETQLRITPARGRDDESVWLVKPRPVQAGRLRIVPADWMAEGDAVRMIDGPAFGTGLHPTTVLCLDALDEELRSGRPESALDIGTGSGILAFAALRFGVPRVVAIDIDADAVRVTAENARLNGLSSRLQIVHAGTDAVRGTWPLVLANVLAAPLMELAPTIAQRVGRSGRLIVGGIRSSLASDVERAYVRTGMRPAAAHARDGWTALTLQASW